MNDEEKDVYIKAKIKDGHIPEKIDNLFNNSVKIIENKGEKQMDENLNMNQNNQENNQNNKEKKKMPVVAQRILAGAACLTLLLGGGNLYATSQGYDNIFFLIKHMVTGEDVRGKENLLSDRDITISYKPIEIAKGTQILVNSIVIKDNEAKLKLEVNAEKSIAPLMYVVKDDNGDELYSNLQNAQTTLYGDVNCDGVVNDSDVEYLLGYSADSESYALSEQGKINADVNLDDTVNTRDRLVLVKYLAKQEGYETLPYIGVGGIVTFKEELKLKGFKKDTKKLQLQIFKNDAIQIATLEIDLENKEITVVGNEEEAKKISEEELKEYLSVFASMGMLWPETAGNEPATFNNERIILTAIALGHKNGTLQKSTLKDGRNAYKITDIHNIAKAFTDIELNINGELEITDGLYLEVVQENNTKYYTYAELTGGHIPSYKCVEVDDISYINGIYNVTFRFYNETDLFGVENFDDVDVKLYQMSMGLILDEDNEYSKYRVSSVSKVIYEDGSITDSEAAKTIQGFLNIMSTREYDSVKMLMIDEIGLIKDYNEWKDMTQNKERDSKGYVKTDIQYSDFKNKMLKYMSEDLFETYNFWDKNVNDILWMQEGGASGYSETVKSVKKIAESEDAITYEVVVEVDAYDGREPERTEKYELKKNENGKYVVSKFGWQFEEEETTEQVTEAIQNYLDLYYVSDYGSDAMLEKLNLVDKIEITVMEQETAVGHAKTNIKYAEFKEKMLTYVTESLFNEEFAENYYEKDEILCYRFREGGARIEAIPEVKSIELKGLNTYVANVGITSGQDSSYGDRTIKFLVEKINGKYVIAAFGDELTKKEVTAAVQGFLNIMSAYESSAEKMLQIEEIGILYQNLSKYNTFKQDSEGYIKTFYKYDDLKRQMLYYMTEECFNTEKFTSFKNIDGYLAVLPTGATGYTTKVEDVKEKSTEGDKVSYEVTYTIASISGEEIRTNTFELQKDDGEVTMHPYKVSVWNR